MRKMSKNRADEDAVSSTNGSVDAEQEVTNGTDPAEKDGAENGGETNGDPSDNSNEEPGINSADGKDDHDPRDAPKKRGRSKSKPKKEGKKSARKGAAKSYVDDDEDEEHEAKKSNRKSATKSHTDTEEIDDEEEYEVEQIVDSKKIRGKLHYLIRWQGFSAASDSWEPADTVNSAELIKKFEETEKTKSPKKATKRKSSSASKGVKSKKGKKPTKTYTKPKESFDYENADSDQEWEVDRVLDVHYKKNGQREFLVHWKGWSTKHDSWEPEDNLNCNELIKKFMDKVESAQSKIQKELRVSPSKTKRFTLQQKSAGRRLSKRQTHHQRVRYDDAE